MNCYETIDLMDVALEGRLPATARPGFEEHLEECGPCRNYLEQLTVTVRSLGCLPRPHVANPRRAELVQRFRQRTRRR